MEYIYAALLLHKAGKAVTEDALKKVLDAVGVSVDTARVKALVSAIKDVDIEEAINTPVAVAASVAPAQAGGPAPAGEKKAEKKEEDEDKKEEEAAAGLAALFG
ncbi:MAG TPA: 50S ribosomal protein P1 [archaeon]|nr:50S ribosomal protein P1 [archaeon]